MLQKNGKKFFVLLFGTPFEGPNMLNMPKSASGQNID